MTFFTHLSNLAKEGFDFVKNATIGTISAIAQDVSDTVETIKDYAEFRKQREEANNDKNK